MPFKTKEEKSAYDKKRYAEKREVIIASQKLYYHANKDIINAARQQIYKENPEPFKLVSREFTANNPQKIQAWKKRYYEKNKVEFLRKGYERKKHRLATDPTFKLTERLRNRLYKALKNNQKNGSAVRDLGCTIGELKSWLEFLFEPGMTWDNYGEWHIDHIKPLASFNLSCRKQLLIACNYANLQLLWAEDTLRKGAR